MQPRASIDNERAPLLASTGVTQGTMPAMLARLVLNCSRNDRKRFRYGKEAGCATYLVESIRYCDRNT